MANIKRTVWIPLDEDLAAALNASGRPLCSLVNDVVRHVVGEVNRDVTCDDGALDRDPY